MSRLRGAHACLALWLCLALAACSSAPPAPTVAPDSGDRLEQAMSLFKNRRFDESAALCDSILEGDPQFAKTETVLFLGAESRYQLGEFEPAYHLYRRLLEAFPFTRVHGVIPSRLLAIGSALAASPKSLLGGLFHDRRMAVEALAHLVVHYAEQPEAAAAWFELGALHFADGEYDLAAEAYRRLAARFPTSAHYEEALFRMACCYQSKARGAGYDHEPLLGALQAARFYVEQFGDAGRHAKAARELIAFAEQEIKDGELRIAEFYRERDEARGAALHDGNAANAFGPVPLAADGAHSLDLLRPRQARPPWKTSGPLPPLPPRGP